MTGSTAETHVNTLDTESTETATVTQGLTPNRTTPTSYATISDANPDFQTRTSPPIYQSEPTKAGESSPVSPDAFGEKFTSATGFLEEAGLDPSEADTRIVPEMKESEDPEKATEIITQRLGLGQKLASEFSRVYSAVRARTEEIKAAYEEFSQTSTGKVVTMAGKTAFGIGLSSALGTVVGPYAGVFFAVSAIRGLHRHMKEHDISVKDVFSDKKAFQAAVVGLAQSAIVPAFGKLIPGGAFLQVMAPVFLNMSTSYLIGKSQERAILSESRNNLAGAMGQVSQQRAIIMKELAQSGIIKPQETTKKNQTPQFEADTRKAIDLLKSDKERTEPIARRILEVSMPKEQVDALLKQIYSEGKITPHFSPSLKQTLIDIIVASKIEATDQEALLRAYDLLGASVSRLLTVQAGSMLGHAVMTSIKTAGIFLATPEPVLAEKSIDEATSSLESQPDIEKIYDRTVAEIETEIRDLSEDNDVKITRIDVDAQGRTILRLDLNPNDSDTTPDMSVHIGSDGKLYDSKGDLVIKDKFFTTTELHTKYAQAIKFALAENPGTDPDNIALVATESANVTVIATDHDDNASTPPQVKGLILTEGDTTYVLNEQEFANAIGVKDVEILITPPSSKDAQPSIKFNIQDSSDATIGELNLADSTSEWKITSTTISEAAPVIQTTPLGNGLHFYIPGEDSNTEINGLDKATWLVVNRKDFEGSTGGNSFLNGIAETLKGWDRNGDGNTEFMLVPKGDTATGKEWGVIQNEILKQLINSGYRDKALVAGLVEALKTIRNNPTILRSASDGNVSSEVAEILGSVKQTLSTNNLNPISAQTVKTTTSPTTTDIVSLDLSKIAQNLVQYDTLPTFQEFNPKATILRTGGFSFTDIEEGTRLQSYSIDDKTLGLIGTPQSGVMYGANAYGETIYMPYSISGNNSFSIPQNFIEALGLQDGNYTFNFDHPNPIVFSPIPDQPTHKNQEAILAVIGGLALVTSLGAISAIAISKMRASSNTSSASVNPIQTPAPATSTATSVENVATGEALLRQLREIMRLPENTDIGKLKAPSEILSLLSGLSIEQLKLLANDLRVTVQRGQEANLPILVLEKILFRDGSPYKICEGKLQRKKSLLEGEITALDERIRTERPNGEKEPVQTINGSIPSIIVRNVGSNPQALFTSLQEGIKKLQEKGLINLVNLPGGITSIDALVIGNSDHAKWLIETAGQLVKEGRLNIIFSSSLLHRTDSAGQTRYRAISDFESSRQSEDSFAHRYQELEKNVQTAREVIDSQYVLTFINMLKMVADQNSGNIVMLRNNEDSIQTLTNGSNPFAKNCLTPGAINGMLSYHNKLAIVVYAPETATLDKPDEKISLVVIPNIPQASNYQEIIQQMKNGQTLTTPVLARILTQKPSMTDNDYDAFALLLRNTLSIQPDVPLHVEIGDNASQDYTSVTGKTTFVFKIKNGQAPNTISIYRKYEGSNESSQNGSRIESSPTGFHPSEQVIRPFANTLLSFLNKQTRLTAMLAGESSRERSSSINRMVLRQNKYSAKWNSSTRGTINPQTLEFLLSDKGQGLINEYESDSSSVPFLGDLIENLRIALYLDQNIAKNEFDIFKSEDLRAIKAIFESGTTERNLLMIIPLLAGFFLSKTLTSQNPIYYRVATNLLNAYQIYITYPKENLLDRSTIESEQRRAKRISTEPYVAPQDTLENVYDQIAYIANKMKSSPNSLKTLMRNPELRNKLLYISQVYKV